MHTYSIIISEGGRLTISMQSTGSAYFFYQMVKDKSKDGILSHFPDKKTFVLTDLNTNIVTLSDWMMDAEDLFEIGALAGQPAKS